MTLPSKPLTPPIRVMIVDDSAFMRKALEKLIAKAGDVEICASVASGELALENMDSAKPDIITMDVEMPGMGGLEAVKAIMARRRTPIIMLSSFTTRGAETTLRALENGAADFIAKPAGGALDLARISMELVDKIHVLGRHHSLHDLPAFINNVSSAAAARSIAPSLPPHSLPPREAAAKPVERPAPQTATGFNPAKKHHIECIALAVSTGGPAALATVCSALPADIRIPIIIVQHMPAGFTKPLADRLNSQSALEVVEAADHMPLQAGRIIIGAAGKQLRVRRVGGRVVAVVAASMNESLYTPSADVLFRSIAEVYGRSCVAFIMTGMGHDGTEGLKELKQAGAYIYGQSEESCVVYGMPRAAAAAGVVNTVVPLDTIAAAIAAAAKGLVI